MTNEELKKEILKEMSGYLGDVLSASPITRLPKSGFLVFLSSALDRLEMKTLEGEVSSSAVRQALLKAYEEGSRKALEGIREKVEILNIYTNELSISDTKHLRIVAEIKRQISSLLPSKDEASKESERIRKVDGKCAKCGDPETVICRCEVAQFRDTQSE